MRKFSSLLLLLLATSIVSAADVGHRIPRYWDSRAYTDNLTVYGIGVVARDSITLGGEAITSWDDVAGVVLDYDKLSNRPTLGGAPLTGAMLSDPGNYPVLNQDTTGNAATASSVPWTGVTGAPTFLTPDGDGSALTGLTKSQVGLDNVDNTADADKPISTLTQAALDAKRALTNLTFTGGPATFDNEVTAAQFSTTAADGEHFINVANSTAPTDNVTTGDCYYDNVALQWLCYDGNSWEGITASSTATFTNKTFDPAGDNNVFTHYDQKDFTILDPVAADNSMLFKARYAMTVSAVHCLAEGGGSITLQILECDSTGGSCAGIDGSTTITCDSDGAADDGSLSNATIDAGDWVKVLYGAPSGTVNTLTYSIYYSESQ